MKIRWRTMATLAASSFFLAGCAISTLPDIKAQKAPDSRYERNLLEGYIELAEMEAAEYDWSNADVFTLRAKSVQDGNIPAPEAVAARDLPSSAVASLTFARYRLTTALDAGGAAKAPEAAAVAQVKYECWMEEQEENLQPDDIAACRAEFELWMQQLEAAVRPEPVAAAPAPEPEPEPVAVPEPPRIPGAMIVFFEFDSASISELEQETIVDAVKSFRDSGASSLSLIGHTDTSGTSAYNVALSKRRVDAVADALRARGIEMDAVKVAASGETRLAIETDDNVKERLNRRVVITFNK